VAFITADELKSHVQGMLAQQQLGDVAPKFDKFIPDAVNAGYQEIVSAFLARGLSKAQADSWARGREFNIHLGIFWVFSEAGALNAFSDTWIKKFDRRKELETVFLADQVGVPIEAVEAGAVEHGTIKRHPLDNFTEPYSRGRDGAGDWKRT
jgi:hypothetical protein